MKFGRKQMFWALGAAYSGWWIGSVAYYTYIADKSWDWTSGWGILSLIVPAGLLMGLIMGAFPLLFWPPVRWVAWITWDAWWLGCVAGSVWLLSAGHAVDWISVDFLTAVELGMWIIRYRTLRELGLHFKSAK